MKCVFCSSKHPDSTFRFVLSNGEDVSFNVCDIHDYKSVNQIIFRLKYVYKLKNVSEVYFSDANVKNVKVG